MKRSVAGGPIGRRCAVSAMACAGLAVSVFAGAAMADFGPLRPVETQRVWLTVPASAWDAAEAANRNSVERVIRYGDTVRVLAERGAADAVRAGGVSVISERPATFELNLGGMTFDPADGVPAMPRGLGGEEPEGSHLRLVQFVGPTKSAWLDELADAGLEVVTYVHPHTYVVYGESAALNRAAGLADVVRWSGVFEPAYKLRPAFRHRGVGERPVNVVIANAADAEVVRREMEALGIDRVGDLRPAGATRSIVQVQTDGAGMSELAQLRGVLSVQEQPLDGGNRGELTNMLVAQQTDGSGLSFPGYADWLANEAGFDGTGVTIAVVDSGTQDGHPDLSPNILPCTGSTCGGSGSSNHGTHTAGIAVGSGASGTTTSNGFLRGQGVAPAANFVEQNYVGVFNNPGGMLLLMTESQRNGAILSTNSWGPAGSPQGYDAQTLEVDIGVRDADDQAAGNQPLAFVLAIMNGNGDGSSSNGFSSLGSPDEAKNIIAVGSQDGQTSPSVQDSGYPSISSNSAHGPALDGRLVPHLVAPGCSIDSSTSGGGHGLLCGTSMAAPHVAGAAALFVERYRDETGGADPSPAMMKAALTASANSLEGFTDADGNTLGAPFDRKQGWGGLNVERLTGADGSAWRYWDQEIVFNDTGESWTIAVSPADPSQPIRIMLTWTDAPGHGIGGSTPAWNNDLDLRVESDGQTYFGNNVASGGFSAPGGSADFQNNLEGVILPAGTGAVTIDVLASDINSDGIPEFGDGTDQDFALACVNCATEPTVVLRSTDVPDVCAPDSATFTVDVQSVAGFITPVELSAPSLPTGLSARISPSVVAPGQSATVTLRGTGALDAGLFGFEIVATEAVVNGEEVTRATIPVPISTPLAGAPSPVGPSGSDSFLSPTFEWSAVAGAETYDLQVAVGGDFANPIVDETLTDSVFADGPTLDPLTAYEWRVRATNPCGSTAWSNPVAFTTGDQIGVLLVDDDDNSPDVRAAYTAILDALGADYDIWDTNNSDNEPTSADLSAYRAVVWFTGDEFGGAAGPGPAGEAALASYLGGGGCVLISSQDYVFDRGTTQFMQDWLGVGTATSDTDHTTVSGEGDAFGAIGAQPLSYPFTNFSDTINPSGVASVAFSGDQGNAGIVFEDSAANAVSVFLGFPIEAISDVAARQSTVGTFLALCTADDSCPGDTDGDENVTALDISNVLAAFGTDDPDADVTGDGSVTALDISLVLSNFGNSGC